MHKQSLLAALLLLCAETTLAAETPGIAVSGDQIYPESLTTTRSGDLIVGSARRTIYRRNQAAHGAAAGAKATVWATLPEAGPASVFGVFVDEAAKTLWACAATYPETDPPGPRSTLYGFDLASGRQTSAWPLPTPLALCNDIAVDANGAVYVTDSINNEVSRLVPGAKQLDLWVGSEAFGSKRSALDGITVLGTRLLVNAINSGQLFAIDIGADGKAGKAVEISMDRKLDTPDGMRAVSGTSMIVAENGKAARVSRIDLHGDRATVVELLTDLPRGTNAVSVNGDSIWALDAKPAEAGNLRTSRARWFEHALRR